jgi:hypothetical protein
VKAYTQNDRERLARAERLKQSVYRFQARVVSPYPVLKTR